MFEIRKMTAEDWEQVSRIYKAGIDTTVATFVLEVPDYDIWDNRHLSQCRLVATDNSGVLAWVVLSPYSLTHAYHGVAEVSLYVDPAAQGKGVGATLLNALSEAARKEGFWSLQSRIIKNNTASLHLHEKCGYRQIGFHEKIAQDRNGEWQDTVLMEKRL